MDALELEIVAHFQNQLVDMAWEISFLQPKGDPGGAHCAAYEQEQD